MEFWMGWLMTTLTSQLFKNNNSGSSPKNTASNGQITSWAKEMDPRDPLLDNTPTKDSIPIRVCLSIGVYQHAQEFQFLSQGHLGIDDKP